MLPGEDGLSICLQDQGQRRPSDPDLTARATRSTVCSDWSRRGRLPGKAVRYLRAAGARARDLAARQARNRLRRPPAVSRSIALSWTSTHVSSANDAGDALLLTSAEFDLLACFVRRPRRVLTRDQILDWTRGRGADPFDRTVDMLVDVACARSSRP